MISLPYLNEASSITFTSDVYGQSPPQGASTLAAINSAVDGLVRGLAIELSPMRVNVVSPGIVNTPIYSGMQKTNVKACSMESRSNSLLNALHNLKTLRNLTFI